MGSVCAEHKFYPSNQLLLKKSLREIDIPPRKLLSRRTTIVAPSIPPETTDMFLDSPKADHETLLQKFLPYNGSDDDDDEDGDPYSSDEFRMFEFKVRRCTRSRSHDWTDCPFAHPGEKARRRDPRRYHYSGTICSEFRRGGCSRGDNCEFAHGVFECWLHPARYRTEACKDGKNCKRKVCFFAHTPRQLRVLPPHCDDNPNPSPVDSPVAGANRKYRNSSHCCFYCHSTVNASPTSTLMGMSHLSPPLSPPLSPVQPRSMSGFSPIYTGVDSCGLNPGVLSYKDAVTELMSNFEAMNMNEVSSHAAATNSRNIDLPWLEVSFNGDDQQQQQQQQFILSPSTPITSSGFRDSLTGGKSFIDHDKLSDACPDLGWVNDLLT